MINRLVRITSRWLTSHPEYGLAVLLPAVVLDSGDGALLPVQIYNEVDNEAVARRVDPAIVPALAIVGQLTHQVSSRRRNRIVDYDNVKVGLHYIERTDALMEARRRAGYVIDAVATAMLGFNEPTKAQTLISPGDPSQGMWRRLGDTELLEVTGLTEYRVQPPIGQGTVIGSLFVTCRVQQVL